MSDALTVEDVGRIVSDALTNFTRKQLPRLISQTVAEAQKAAGSQEGEAGGEEQEGAARAQSAADTPELRKLQKRLEKVEKENAQMRATAEKARQDVERAERHGFIKTELSRHKVIKPDLAFKALKDDIFRAEDGDLYAKDEKGNEVSAADYIAAWVKSNPEFLPPRGAAGSGANRGRHAEV